MGGFLTGPLICMYLMFNDSEHFFIYPLTIVDLLWENVYLAPLPIFKSGYLVFFVCFLLLS
jgi:hypothetical protein